MSARMTFRDKIFQLNILAINFPMLEVRGYIETNILDNVSLEQYNQYCICLFNLLSEIRSHISERSIGRIIDHETIFEEMKKIVYAPDIILKHLFWWESSGVNMLSYSDGFKMFIKTIIEENQE